MRMSQQVVISGVGVWHPEESITNEELVSSYNAYVDAFNEEVSRAATSIKKKARWTSTG
jgi:3-oxoacyl-[acyl-carrier-protein] synthase III